MAGLGARRGKRGRGDDAYLGVFAEADSSDGENGRRDSKSNKQPLAAKPVTFAKASVSTAAPKPSAPPPRPSATAATAATAGAAPGRGGLGSAVANSSSRGGLGSGPSRAAPAEKLDRDFGTFEAHSKGIGSKLLAKMGWKEGMGLGKSGHGVVNPLEQKLRPNSMGLGYGGFKEVTAKAKQQQARILHGDHLVDEAAGADVVEGAAALGGAAEGAAPRRRGERRVLRVRTAAELLEEWEVAAKASAAGGASVGSATVLDMRGPQVRVHASMSEVDTSGAAGDAFVQDRTAGGSILPELRHNVRMLVDLAEVGLQQRYRKLRAEKEAVRTYTDRRDAHQAAAAQTGARLEGLEEVRSALARCVDAASAVRRRVRLVGTSASGAAAGGSGADTALAEWAALWDALRRAHPREWGEYALHQSAAALAIPVFRAHMAGWRPLQEPGRGAALFAQWERALCTPAAGTAGAGAAQQSFGALLYTVLLPPIRSALANDWSACDAAPAVALLEAWRPLLPPALFGEMVEGQVMPRLLRELASWAPPPRDSDDATTEHPAALHTWLLPWAPLLPPPGLRMLFPQVRHKLASTLAELPPADPEASRAAAAMLGPWREVLDPPSWRALVMRSVLPKLDEAMCGFEVNPADQQLSPVRALFCWSDLVPTELLSQLTLRHLFPPWLCTLHEWLLQHADFAEVAHWYSGWKTLLRRGAPALLLQSAVVEMLNRALDMLNAAIDGSLPPLPLESVAFGGGMEGAGMHPASPTWGMAEEDEAPPPPPPPPEHEPGRCHDGVGDGAGLEVEPARSRVDGEPTLREMLEQLAASHDIVFMPLSSRHEGKQVFSFGGVSVYLDTDKELVYARHGGGKAFRPTNLRQLVMSAGEKGADKKAP